MPVILLSTPALLACVWLALQAASWTPLIAFGAVLALLQLLIPFLPALAITREASSRAKRLQALAATAGLLLIVLAGMFEFVSPA